MLILSVEQAAADSILLKPKFTPGRITYVELKQDIDQTIGGITDAPSIETTVRHTFGVWHKVEAVSPSKGTRIVLTYDRVCMSIDGPMISESFDSDVDDPRDESNMVAAAMGPMLGMPMTMELDKDNQVTSFTGMDAIRKRIEETTGGGMMYQQMKDELDDESYKAMWGESLLILYANKEVKVGDSWTRTLEHKSGAMGDLVSEYKCTLKSIGTEDGRKVAIVAYKATVSRAPDSESKPNAMGIVTKLDSGEFEGTATYDVERGEFVKQVSEGRVKVKMTPPGAEAEEAGMTLDQKIKSRVAVLAEAERQKQKIENQKKPKHQPDE